MSKLQNWVCTASKMWSPEQNLLVPKKFTFRIVSLHFGALNAKALQPKLAPTFHDQ
jgi:hypothetical protein